MVGVGVGLGTVVFVGSLVGVVVGVGATQTTTPEVVTFL